MRFRKMVLLFAVMATVSLGRAKAVTITNLSTALTAATSTTELGRPSRNSVPQDWSGTEGYPGILSTSAATTYYYTVFTLPASLFTGAPYVEINTYEPGNTAVYFVTAYAGSYNPGSRGTNWLGDQGFSGNYQTNDGGDFEVVLPSNTSLVLVMTTTGGGTAGLGTAINLNVAAYADTMFDDPTPVITPEPSSWLMVGTGLLGSMGVLRRRFATA